MTRGQGGRGTKIPPKSQKCQSSLEAAILQKVQKGAPSTLHTLRGQQWSDLTAPSKSQGLETMAREGLSCGHTAAGRAGGAVVGGMAGSERHLDFTMKFAFGGDRLTLIAASPAGGRRSAFNLG